MWLALTSRLVHRLPFTTEAQAVQWEANMSEEQITALWGMNVRHLWCTFMFCWLNPKALTLEGRLGSKNNPVVLCVWRSDFWHTGKFACFRDDVLPSRTTKLHQKIGVYSARSWTKRSLPAEQWSDTRRVFRALIACLHSRPTAFQIDLTNTQKNFQF